MVRNIKIRSQNVAIENVRTFFSNTPNDDAISLEDAFRAWGRPNPENVEKNKAWLSNKLTALKYHNLIVPIYVHKDGRRKLEKLRLTLEGKKALGRIEGYSENDKNNGNSHLKNGGNSSNDFSDIYKKVAEWQKNHQEFEVEFKVSLKNTNKE